MKAKNTTGSAMVHVTLSRQSVRLLDQLAAKGIYGRNRAEVAGRFVDRALQRYVRRPVLSAR